ncbi:hypothetical protein Hsw_PB0013 (plasmid) [Hymenobacter swuensis DY53]|uniref:Tape measure protein N-terminal domain-containing protein n=2 Tax=Hymenobacter TaxID=89966 RepID=W8ERT3_9BACT|nr:hypothetical protein Hsw_PB0013 [Hymenobacter swuensis DY53]
MTEAFAALDKLAARDEAFRESVVRGEQERRKSMVDAARASIEAQQTEATALLAANQKRQQAVQLVKALTAAQNELIAAQLNARNSSEREAANKALNDNIRQVKAARAEVKQLDELVAQATEQARQETEKLTAAKRQAADATKAEAAAGKQAAAAAKEQEKAAAAAAKEADKQARAASVLGRLEAQLLDLTERRAKALSGSEAKGYNKQITDVTNQIKGLKSAGGTNVTGGFFSSLLGQVTGVAGGLFTLDKLFQGFKDGLRNAADIAGVKGTFNALAGGAAAGASEVRFLRKETDELGLDFISTANSYKLLYAAGKEANLATSDTRSIFEGIVAEGKVLGISNDKVASSLRAVSQMLGKGTVNAEEFRGQLGDVLPDAAAIAARALGVTTEQFDVMLRKGQIVSRDFLPKFAAEMKKTYGGASKDAAIELQANLNRIENVYVSVSSTVVGASAPLIRAFANLLEGNKGQAEIAEQASAAYERQSAAIQSLNSTIPQLVKRGEELSERTNLNKEEQAELAKIIATVADAIPGAVTKFDEYGKALGINTDAVAAFLQNNQKITNRAREVALRENRKFLDSLLNQQQGVVDQLNDVVMVEGVARLQKAETLAVEGVSVEYKTPFGTQEESDAKTKELNQLNLELLTKIADTRALLDSYATGGKVNKGDAGTVRNLSIILELQTKIKDLTAKRDAVTPGAITKDNPNGGGVSKIQEYNQQLEELQKQLDALLGKSEKGLKDLLSKRTAALKALLEEQKRLRGEFERAELQSLKDAGQARAQEQLRQDYNAVAQIEKNLKEREAAYRKVGGTGSQADGLIDSKDQERLDGLRMLAVQRFQEEIERINRENSRRILELQKDSDAKELAQLRAKFAEQIREVEQSGTGLQAALDKALLNGNQVQIDALASAKASSDQLLDSLREAQAEQERLLLRAQALKDIDMRQQLKVDGVNAGVPMVEQAVNVTADDTSAAQANAAERLSFVQRLMDKLYTLEVDGEKKRQKAILQAQIDGNQERMLQYENDYSEQAIGIKSSLAAMQQGLYDQLNAIGEVETKKMKKLDLLELLGVAPADREEVKVAIANVADAVTSGLTQIYQTQQQQAENRANSATTAISELSSQLQAEVALRKEGSASNIATLREQIQEQKKVRAEAVKEQRKAAQAQVVIDTLTQGSSVATAAAQALAALTPLGPFGFLLGIAAATTIVGAFTAAKVKAFQAAGKSGNDGGGGFFKGGYTGDGDKHTESNKLGDRGYTYHKKEFVMNNELTSQYRYALLEPLHLGRPQDIDWQAPQMKALLPDLELPKKLQQERQAAIEQRLTVQFAPMQAQFQAMQQELAAIKKHVGVTAARPDVVAMPDGSTMQIDPVTGSSVRRYTEGAKVPGVA